MNKPKAIGITLMSTVILSTVLVPAMQVKATVATEQSDSKEGSKIVNTTLPEDTTAKALS